MVVPLFGWSAGDIVISIKILYHIGEAFREAGGAKDQYAETASWLDSFAHDLEQIREYVADNPTAKYTDSIKQQIANIDPHYVHFEKYLQKHDSVLSSTSSVGAVKQAFVKVQWAVKELKGQADYLKTRISGPLMSINLLLSLQHQHALEQVSQTLASLPQGTTVDAIERIVLDVAAQLHQTELGLVELQASLNDQMTTLMHLKTSIQNDMSEGGQKILDAQTSMLSATLTAIDGSRSSALKSLNNLGRRLDEVDQQMADTSTSLKDMLDDQKVAVQVCQMHLDHLQQTVQTVDQQPSQHALVESKGDWQELLRNAGIFIGAFMGLSNMVTLRNIDAGLHASYQARVDQQSSIYHSGPPTSAQSMMKRSHHDMSNVPIGPSGLVPNLLPQRYQPTRETGYTGFCGLAGDLSIIMGLVAFSMLPWASMMELGKKFTRAVSNLPWPLKALIGLGRVDRHGLVVHIGVDRSHPVSKECLDAWERGDYGAIIWA